MSLGGVLPVIAAPFDEDGELDPSAIDAEVDWLFDQGVDGVVIGLVSEILRLSSKERDRAVRQVAKAARGRGAVVASVGAESAHTACRHARHAAEYGAAAIMAVPPIAASGDVGDSVPVSLQAEIFERLGDRVVFKPEAHPIGPTVTRPRNATSGKAWIFEGTGGIALVDSFRRGIVGTMPGPDVCWALVRLWRALEAGDDEIIYRISGPLCSLISMQSTLDSFVVVQKYLLNRQGELPNAVVRGPIGYRLDTATRREVDRLVGRLREAVAAADAAAISETPLHSRDKEVRK